MNSTKEIYSSRFATVYDFGITNSHANLYKLRLNVMRTDRWSKVNEFDKYVTVMA